MLLRSRRHDPHDLPDIAPCDFGVTAQAVSDVLEARMATIVKPAVLTLSISYSAFTISNDVRKSNRTVLTWPQFQLDLLVTETVASRTEVRIYSMRKLCLETLHSMRARKPVVEPLELAKASFAVWECYLVRHVIVYDR
jgi:hypothetical protein